MKHFPNGPLLNVSELSKTFFIHHLDRKIDAFRGISFVMDQGEFLLLRAPNGAGKSTLLRCLWRSCIPSAGAARFCTSAGQIVDLATCAEADVLQLRRTQIGFVSQFLRARPRVPALDIVAEPLRSEGATQAAARTRAKELLEIFGVRPELWPAYPSTFSGGEQQKVNLARALIVPKRLMLLDEPTASLDAGARTALVQGLVMLKQQGVALIGVFHHPEDVMHLVDGVIDLETSIRTAMAMQAG
jgi:alpha-D-ribose 1-methylphosphonate 5-triphosphate synthase subunit PhnL